MLDVIILILPIVLLHEPAQDLSFWLFCEMNVSIIDILKAH